jgi:hypothetical protein
MVGGFEEPSPAPEIAYSGVWLRNEMPASLRVVSPILVACPVATSRVASSLPPDGEAGFFTIA